MFEILELKQVEKEVEAYTDDTNMITPKETSKKQSVRVLYSKKRKRGQVLDVDDTLLCKTWIADGSTCLSILWLDLWDVLFDANWIKRHGAAITLVHLFQNIQEPFLDGLDECTVRCVCVLLLDRYADYAADDTVAPIREVVAQLLALLLQKLPLSTRCTAVVLIQQILVVEAEWHVHHGATLALLHLVLLARKKAELKTIWSPLLETQLITALKDCAMEDVQANIIRILSCVMQTHVDVHLSSESLYCFYTVFLNVLYEKQKNQNVVVADAAVEAVLEAFAALSSTVLDSFGRDATMGEMQAVTIPYIGHVSIGIHTHALLVLDHLNIPPSYELLQAMMQTLAKTYNNDILLLQVWKGVLRRSPRNSNQILDFVNFQWTFILDNVSKSVAKMLSSTTPDAYPLFAHGLVVFVVELIGRNQQADAFAKLATVATSYLKERSGIEQMSIFYILLQILSEYRMQHREDGQSATESEQKGNAVNLLHDLEPFRILCIQLLYPTNKEESSNDFLFQEQISQFTVFQNLSMALLEEYFGVKKELKRKPEIPSSLMLRKMAETINTMDYMSLQSSGTFTAANNARIHLITMEETVQSNFTKMKQRLISLVAGTYVYLVDLTKSTDIVQVNPLVKGLMTSSKEENVVLLQHVVGHCISTFFNSPLGKSKTKCCEKVFQNLINSAAVKRNILVPSLRTRGALCALEAIVQENEDLVLVTSKWKSCAFDTEDTSFLYKHLVLLQIALHVMKAPQHLTRLLPHLINLSLKKSSFEEKNNDIEDLQNEAVNTIAVLTKFDTTPCLNVLFCTVFDAPAHTLDDTARRVALQIMAALVQGLPPLSLLECVPRFVHYSMVCMNMTKSEEVQRLGSETFSYCLPLIPLYLGNQRPDERSLSQDVHSENSHDTRDELNSVSTAFLARLMEDNGEALVHIPIQQHLPLGITLREYQQHGINWLCFLASSGLHGILADDMGLGKTLQSLSAVVHSIENEGVIQLKPSLIVCPKSLLYHWKNEMELYFPMLLQPILWSQYILQNNKEKKIQTKKNVIIASYSQLRSLRNQRYIKETVWHYCILDEGHVVRNPNTETSKTVRSITAKHRLVLTGTPIQNHVQDLWTLFDFLMPGYLGNHETFRHVFQVPITKSKKVAVCASVLSEGALLLQKLHRKIVPFVLRRTKSAVLTDLPPKVIQDLSCPLTSIQQNLYDAMQDEAFVKSGEWNALQRIMSLRKLCVHPRLVLPVHSVGNSVCIGRRCISLPPTIRDWKHSSKLVGLYDLLVNNGLLRNGEEEKVTDHRYLIFAQLRDTLMLVEEMFTAALPSVVWKKIDGRIPSSERMDIVSTFNKDPSIDVLLSTTKVGGLGLNLTGADVVIFIEHAWNPFEDLQAMDRAHRIGQKKSVLVFRLVVPSGLDQNIMDTQISKRGVADAVVQDIEPSSRLNVKNVLNLLSTSCKDNVQNNESDEKSSSSNLPTSVQEMLKNAGELWNESEYDSLRLVQYNNDEAV